MTNKPQKRPTLADVAALAQVSTGTVSLVLNDRNSRVPISSETRKRVLEAVNAIGYTPNPVAQMLVRGKNHLVGVFTYEPIFPFDEQDFYYHFLVGIEHEATCCDYNLLLFTRGRASQDRKIYERGQNSLALADGAILLGPNPDRDELHRLHSEGYPFVFIGRREVPGCQIDWVSSDYKSASTKATQYLLDLGHRNIGYVRASLLHEPILDRITGCQKAVADCQNVSFTLIQIEQVAQPEDLKRFLNETGITALLCTNLNLTDKIWSIAERAGLKIPGDISLISLGDGEPITHSQLQLTHLKLNRTQVGAAAMRALLDRLDNRDLDPQNILIPCELIYGETTSPPP